ncbi:hypothetical protein A6A06_26420 [Streptomyces sp. CB02923]|uniref:hypothetical protein n=1 Tax=Streptomyces sp. CB02923 TaxID=1718985 RepID=UPI00093B6A97|nr:hypothetical protein [Streptomyces sp. CB02923]OKH99118.1 hypothetical protein A6A06_26420 [Streptomyces sp. CB02923]
MSTAAAPAATPPEQSHTAPRAPKEYVSLDTGVLIHAKHSAAYLNRLDTAMGKRRPCIVPQVNTEFGAGGSQERAWLNTFLKNRSGKKSSTYATKAAIDKLKARAADTGQNLEAKDTQVVSQTKMLKLSLITADVRLANNLDIINRKYPRAYPVERLRFANRQYQAKQPHAKQSQAKQSQAKQSQAKQPHAKQAHAPQAHTSQAQAPRVRAEAACK